MENNLSKFKSGLEKLKISLDDRQISMFMEYYELLIEKNKVMNLTAITDFDEVIEKHFLDSLAVCQVYDFKEETKILDLGTGAGLPGIPLKIVFPKIDLLLVDSLQKRVKFLDEAILRLGLKKVKALHARAEELAKNSLFREQFNLCVSRAVANLSTLSEYCIPFLKEDGLFISYKSGEIEEEVKQAKRAVSVLGGKLEEVYKFNLNEQKRSFVIIRKVKKTPRAYPRKAGLPTKEPLR